jgi:hypothetical protein
MVIAIISEYAPPKGSPNNQVAAIRQSGNHNNQSSSTVEPIAGSAWIQP